MRLDESRTSLTRDDWRTPPWVVSLVREALGEIHLDPCAAATDHFAAQNWTQGGLDRPWSDGWYCNPPYGRALQAWAQKAVSEAREGIFLAPARTETKWFRLLADRADLLAFPVKRIKFIDPTGADRTGPKFPNVLMYFGRSLPLVARVLGPHCTLLVRYGRNGR